MRWARQLLAHLRRWRRIRAAKADKAPLREFVYLDDVSVYSLLASRQGALASEYTETMTSSRRSEVSSSLGASTAGVGSKLESGQSKSSQVLRKSTIQAAFKELYEGEEGRLVISPPPPGRPPVIRDWNELDRMVGTVLFEKWIINPEGLTRGRLAVLDVELQADPIFRVSSIISSLRNIVQESPKMFSALIPNLEDVAAINRVLDYFLVGLIPIRCRLAEFDAVHTSRGAVLVHKAILDQLPVDSGRRRMPVHMVGVTEERLYWKDVRRVLFANSRVQVLCRMSYDGLRDSWLPVKLINVLDEVVPGLGQQFTSFGHSALSDPLTPDDGAEAETRLRQALALYRQALAAQLNGVADIKDQASPDPELRGVGGDVEAVREVFASIAKDAFRSVDQKPSPAALAQLRATALRDAGLSPDGSLSIPAPIAARPVEPTEDEWILDTEIVAIYW